MKKITQERCDSFCDYAGGSFHLVYDGAFDKAYKEGSISSKDGICAVSYSIVCRDPISTELRLCFVHKNRRCERDILFSKYLTHRSICIHARRFMRQVVSGGTKKEYWKPRIISEGRRQQRKRGAGEKDNG